MRRWVFSLSPSPTLLRLSPFCRGPSAHPATSRVLHSRRHHPALLRASRSRFPAVRQFGTEPQPRLSPDPSRNPDLRCTQPLQASTTRPPVLPPPTSSAKPAHSNHPPARNLQPDYRPESCRLARSHSPDPSRNTDRAPNYTIKGRSSPAIHHSRTTICARRPPPFAAEHGPFLFPPPSLPSAAEHGPFLLPRCPSQPNTSLSSFLAAPRSRARALPSFPSFRLPRRLPRREPGTKKRPHVAVRASVSPKIGRITSRSSRRSP